MKKYFFVLGKTAHELEQLFLVIKLFLRFLVWLISIYRKEDTYLVVLMNFDLLRLCEAKAEVG